MKIAVIYARYSSDRQTEQSIDGQLRVCQEYAQRNDIVIVDTYIDRAMTGTNDDREAFQKMLSDSDKKEWDYVLVYKLDRFSRNKYEMAMHRKHLKDNNIKLLSAMEQIPDSPEGILLESLLEGMNQYYSEELSQKTKRGMHETRLKGNFIGGDINFGYSVVGNKVVINEHEAPIVKEIFERYANGEEVYQIVRDLNKRGPIYREKYLQNTTIYYILRKEKYTGIYRINDYIYDNIYPQIVTPEVYAIVRAKIDANKQGRHIREDKYLLKGKIFRGNCGRPLYSYSGTAVSGKRFKYYRCKNIGYCKGKSMNKHDLEGLVTNALVNLVSTDECIEQLTKDIIKVHSARMKANKSIDILRSELDKTSKALTNVMKAIEQGIITDTTKDRLVELETQNRNLEGRIQVEKAKVNTKVSETNIKRQLKQSMGKEPQQLVDLLIERIDVYHDRIDITLRYTAVDSPNIYSIPNNPDRNTPRRDYVFISYNCTYSTPDTRQRPMYLVPTRMIEHSIAVNILI